MLLALSKELTGSEENTKEHYQSIFKVDLNNTKSDVKLQIFSPILVKEKYTCKCYYKKYIFDYVIKDTTKDSSKEFKFKAFDLAVLMKSTLIRRLRPC